MIFTQHVHLFLLKLPAKHLPHESFEFSIVLLLLTNQLNMSYDKHYLGEHVITHSSKSSSCLIAAQSARTPCFPWSRLLLKYTYTASPSCKTKRSLLCLDLNRAIDAHQLFKLSPHHSRSYQRDFLSGNLCRTKRSYLT